MEEGFSAFAENEKKYKLSSLRKINIIVGIYIDKLRQKEAVWRIHGEDKKNNIKNKPFPADEYFLLCWRTPFLLYDKHAQSI